MPKFNLSLTISPAPLINPSNYGNILNGIGVKKSGCYSTSKKALNTSPTLNLPILVEKPSKKNPSTALWVKKVVTDSKLGAERPLVEVICQEFLRLMNFSNGISHQPKTRLTVEDNSLAVLSKFSETFVSFQQKMPSSDEILNCKGAGRAILLAYLLRNRDLNLGNIGLDNQHVIVIDSELCLFNLGLEKAFAESGLPLDQKFTLNAEELNRLPQLNIFNFNPDAWLDIYQHGQLNPDNRLAALANNEFFAKEINETILSFICFPEKYFKSFVKHYITEDDNHELCNRMIDFFIMQQKNLTDIAIKNEKFIRYIKTEAATVRLQETIQYFSRFILTGKHELFQDKENAESSILDNFYRLKTASQPTVESNPSTPRTNRTPKRSHSMMFSSAETTSPATAYRKLESGIKFKIGPEIEPEIDSEIDIRGFGVHQLFI